MHDFLEAIRRLSALDDPVLAEAALAEAKAFLKEYTASSLVPQALGLTADLLIRLGREAEAAGYLAALVVGNPESSLWPAYSLELPNSISARCGTTRTRGNRAEGSRRRCSGERSCGRGEGTRAPR